MTPPERGSKDYVHERLVGLGNERVLTAELIGNHIIPGDLLLAIGLRESGLHNINNEADTDRGCMQISDLYHRAWLEQQPGCPVGSWRADPTRRASDPKHCPQYTPAVKFAFHMLMGNYHAAKAKHLDDDTAVRIAVAAYNAGFGGAMKGYHEGDVDAHTTGGDYSFWVLDKRMMIYAWLQEHPHWRIPGKAPEAPAP